MGTFSKALGTYGAYLCGSRVLVDYFINKCRTFIFNTGLPPALAGATMKSLALLSHHPERLLSLLQNEEIFRREMEARGRKMSSVTAIMPLLVGKDQDTMAVSQRLYDRGLFILGIRRRRFRRGKAGCG